MKPLSLSLYSLLFICFFLFFATKSKAQVGGEKYIICTSQPDVIQVQDENYAMRLEQWPIYNFEVGCYYFACNQPSNTVVKSIDGSNIEISLYRFRDNRETPMILIPQEGVLLSSFLAYNGKSSIEPTLPNNKSASLFDQAMSYVNRTCRLGTPAIMKGDAEVIPEKAFYERFASYEQVQDIQVKWYASLDATQMKIYQIEKEEDTDEKKILLKTIDIQGVNEMNYKDFRRKARVTFQKGREYELALVNEQGEELEPRHKLYVYNLKQRQQIEQFVKK